MNTAQIATDAHALAVKLGAKLIETEKLCAAGATDGHELSGLAGEINYLMGVLHGIYFTAKAVLPEDDFNQLVYRCGIEAGLIYEGIDRVQSEIFPVI